MGRMAGAAADPAITVVPANEATWEDIAAIFGTRGEAAACWCQRYKLKPREAFKHWPAEVRADRLRRQTRCGEPAAGETTGLVAYRGGAPAGWCAVEPRAAYEGLRRVYRVPWLGRDEDKADASVFAVTCLFTRAGFRRQGVSRALARAAVGFARDRGARAIEASPMATTPGEDIAWGELHVGSRSVFADAGFVEVGRPTPRRFVMRIDFAGAATT